MEIDWLKEHNHQERVIKDLKEEINDLKKGVVCCLNKEEVDWITNGIGDPLMTTHIIQFLRMKSSI